MSPYPKIDKQIAFVLKAEARTGITTKNNVATKTWSRVERMGGPGAFGIGRAAMITGCMHYINAEVTRQFKSSPGEHNIRYVLGPIIPPDLRAILGRCQCWIALTDGTDALWKHWRSATPHDFFLNYELKRKKAEQTLNAARGALEVHDYMIKNGIASFAALFDE